MPKDLPPRGVVRCSPMRFKPKYVEEFERQEVGHNDPQPVFSGLRKQMRGLFAFLLLHKKLEDDVGVGNEVLVKVLHGVSGYESVGRRLFPARAGGKWIRARLECPREVRAAGPLCSTAWHSVRANEGLVN